MVVSYSWWSACHPSNLDGQAREFHARHKQGPDQTYESDLPESGEGRDYSYAARSRRPAPPQPGRRRNPVSAPAHLPGRIWRQVGGSGPRRTIPEYFRSFFNVRGVYGALQHHGASKYSEGAFLMTVAQEIEKLLNDYRTWLRDKTTLREVNGEWVEITTPYVDRHNDALQIYARAENGALIPAGDA